jgi:hypothetical protein
MLAPAYPVHLERHQGFVSSHDCIKFQQVIFWLCGLIHVLRSPPYRALKDGCAHDAHEADDALAGAAALRGLAHRPSAVRSSGGALMPPPALPSRLAVQANWLSRRSRVSPAGARLLSTADSRAALAGHGAGVLILLAGLSRRNPCSRPCSHATDNTAKT